jgi:hypothetical protein
MSNESCSMNKTSIFFWGLPIHSFILSCTSVHKTGWPCLVGQASACLSSGTVDRTRCDSTVKLKELWNTGRVARNQKSSIHINEVFYSSQQCMYTVGV